MYRFILLVLIIVFTPLTASADTLVSSVPGGSITGKVVWTGSVTVAGPVTVEKGASLTVKAGTIVKFAAGAGLTVAGQMKAEGIKGALVTFTSAAASPTSGDWAGIAFSEADDGSTLKFCQIEYAASVGIAACSPSVSSCVIRSGVQGIAVARKSTSRLSGNTISDMSDCGITCQMGATPVISGNTIRKCVQNGVISSKDSGPVIKGNTITGCVAGINLSKDVPPVEDNVIKENTTGIYTTMADNGLVLRGNHITANASGILCRQFSSPTIEKNDISGNKEQGIVCYRASSPVISRNRVSRNGVGIFCEQLCNPRITANDIHDNDKGIYLDLSSYAIIKGNNIYDNKAQVELGNMSSDWEYKVNNKPVRGGQAQNISMANRGKAVAQAVEDRAQIMGYVDATGNWWGDKGVAEMDKKGVDANIEGFIDYYDVPTRTYEGYSGIYVQDRIKYEGWKKSKIKDAGY